MRLALFLVALAAAAGAKPGSTLAGETTAPVRAFDRYCIQTELNPAMMKSRLKDDRAKALSLRRVKGMPKNATAKNAQAWQVKQEGVTMQVVYRSIQGEPAGKAGLLHECSVIQSSVAVDAMRLDIERMYQSELAMDGTHGTTLPHIVSYNTDFRDIGMRPVTLSFHGKAGTPVLLSTVNQQVK